MITYDFADVGNFHQLEGEEAEQLATLLSRAKLCQLSLGGVLVDGIGKSVGLASFDFVVTDAADVFGDCFSGCFDFGLVVFSIRAILDSWRSSWLGGLGRGRSGTVGRHDGGVDGRGLRDARRDVNQHFLRRHDEAAMIEIHSEVGFK